MAPKWPQDFVFFNCHGCQTFIFYEIHCYLSPTKSWHSNSFLGSVKFIRQFYYWIWNFEYLIYFQILIIAFLEISYGKPQFPYQIIYPQPYIYQYFGPPLVWYQVKINQWYLSNTYFHQRLLQSVNSNFTLAVQSRIFGQAKTHFLSHQNVYYINRFADFPTRDQLSNGNSMIDF